MDQFFSSLRDKGASGALSSSGSICNAPDSHSAAVLAAAEPMQQDYTAPSPSSPTNDSGWAMVVGKKKYPRKRSTSLSGPITLASKAIDLHAESAQCSKSQDRYESNAYSKSSPSYSAVALPCKFFASGGCAAGRLCRFLHIKPGLHHVNPDLGSVASSNGKSKSEICSYHLKGSRRHGDRNALEQSHPQVESGAKCSPSLRNEPSGDPRGSAALLASVSSWPTAMRDGQASGPGALKHSCSLMAAGTAALGSTLATTGSSLVDPDSLLGPFEKLTPSYDRSLFDDHDSDQDILHLAGSEWMKEFELASNRNTQAPSSFRLLPDTGQPAMLGEKEVLTLAPQSSLALTLDRPHSVVSQPVRRHISRFGFNDSEGIGLSVAAGQAPSIPGASIDYYDERGESALMAIPGTGDYFYQDYPEPELAYDAYYHLDGDGSGDGDPGLGEAMVLGSAASAASTAITNPALYHPAAGMPSSLATMSALPLSYSSVIKSHGGGLNSIPAGVLSLAMDNPTDTSELSELCAFAKTGSCRYGAKCRYVHGDMCPYCQLFVLHPTNHELRDAHMLKCSTQLDDPSLAGELGMEGLSLTEHDLIECCICYERISTKPDARFGLLNCEHAFCLECIRSWRSSQNLDPSVIRSCPICRTVTHFITPSSVWTRDPALKASIIEEYKGKLRSIPCKYFRYGEAHCPFGTSCFYAHMGRDGRPIDASHGPKLRTCMNDDEQVRVLSEIRLSDFINISSAII